MNTATGSYPNITNPKFYEDITRKKEFYDNRGKNEILGYLKPQQRLLSNFINPLTQYNSLLVFHSVGVGKTLTAISIAENFKENYSILILVKNKTIELNFRNELNAYMIHNIDKNYIFMNYGTLVNRVLGRTMEDGSRKIIEPFHNINNTVLILDEAHNVTNNDSYLAIKRVLDRSLNYKILMLSATPMYDNVKEIFEICNLLGDNLPIRKDLVKYGLIQINQDSIESSAELTTKGKDLVLKSLLGKVSYLLSDTKNFPKRIDVGDRVGNLRIFKCKMSNFQDSVYSKTLNNKKNFFSDSTHASIIVYPDSTFGSKGFITNVIKNKDHSFLKKNNIGKYSCKLYSILDHIDRSSGPVFLYSNFVSNEGVELLKVFLYENGFKSFSSRSSGKKYIILDANVDPVRRNKLIKEFNKDSNKYGNEIKVIIGSPVVSEGVTFKNISQIHILDPYWNMSLISQVIGRGVRFNSHAKLSKKDQKCYVFLYAAISKSKSIDLLKYQLSDRKNLIIKKFETDIRSIAIDCSLNKKVNGDYKCFGEPVDTIKIDGSTYDLALHDPPMYEFIEDSIKKLFNIGYFYDISTITKYVMSFNTSVIKENVWFVLSKMIDNSEVLLNRDNVKCNIIMIGGYYIVNPVDEKINTQFFDKIYKAVKESRTLDDVLGVVNVKKPREIIKKISIGKGLYGNYMSKTGKTDNKFRIIDNRDTTKPVTGKVCSTWSKDDLLDVCKYLKISVPTRSSKDDLCKIIEKYLKMNRKII
jgi:DNA replication protein DnaC